MWEKEVYSACIYATYHISEAVERGSKLITSGAKDKKP